VSNPPQPGPRLRCKECGQKFTRPHGTRRLYCFDCRPATAEIGLHVVPSPIAQQGESVEARTRAELTTKGQEQSALGAAALVAANQIDTGGLRGMQLAALLKQWADLLEKALADAPAESADELDILRQRRDSR
jgi:hypothetical protein